MARRQALREGRISPDEDAVHREHLCEGAPAPALAIVKDFLRFYIATSRPRLDELPTVDSINIVAEWFFAGFTRVTGTDTDEGERSEVYNVSPISTTPAEDLQSRTLIRYLVGPSYVDSRGYRRQ